LNQQHQRDINKSLQCALSRLKAETGQFEMSCCSGVQVALSRLKAETQTDSSALIFCTVSVPTSNLVAVLRMPMPFRGDLLIADAVSVSTVGRPIGRPFLVPCTLARKASHDALVDQAAAMALTIPGEMWL
jgi:hypothetical protein